MPERGRRARMVLAPAAESDIREALHWSLEKFGGRAAARYRDLLKQAFADLAADPERPGSQQRPELAGGVRSYHLYFSRGRARSALGVVRSPRHFVIYRRRDENTIEVLRVLHDSRDLERHIPGEYR